MGRKPKAPRTKNSYQPSSSSRCAELLGTNQPSLVGFKTMPTELATASTFKLFDEIAESKLELDYQLIFKKMAKKDATTKTKALQEFVDILSTSDVDTILTVLPIWTKMYCSLATDIEHRIRELCQQAHSVLVAQAGKSIAPYVKQFAPIWIVSRYDTYSLAANFAENSLNNIFPAEKNEKLFIFCHKEILQYFVDNLTKTMPGVDGNSLSPEEREIKNDLITKCCLQGYALYLNRIPCEEFEKEISQNNNIINNQKFWNLHKHKLPNVRSAWFECLNAILELHPSLLDDQVKATVANVFSSLHELNPIVLHNLWSAGLLVMHKIENWNQCVDIEKLVITKLLKEIKNSFNGNACIVSSYILPFIDKLQKVMPKENILSFYEKLLTNFKTGLQSTGNFTNSEIGAFGQCYYECISFILNQCKSDALLKNENDCREFSRKIVDTHIVDVLEWTIDNFKNLYKYLFLKFGKLLLAWNGEKIQNEMTSYLWNELDKLLIKTGAKVNENEKILLAHDCLIVSLHPKQLNKSKQVVKFEDVKNDKSENVSQEIVVNQTYEDQLNKLVFKLCKLYLKDTEETCNIAYIEHLKNIFVFYENEQLLKNLCEPDSLVDFVNKLSLWLLKPSLCDENIVDIILIVFKYLNSAEQSLILKKLLKFSNEMINNWVLVKILNGSFYADSSIMNLLSEDTFTNILIKCAQSALSEQNPEKFQFLTKYFQHHNRVAVNDDTHQWMETDACRDILNIIVTPFADDDCANNILEMCIRFVIQILENIKDGNGEQQRFLFKKLMELSINEKIFDRLTSELQEDVTLCWQHILLNKSIQIDDNLLSEYSEIFSNKLKTTDSVSPKDIKQIAKISSEFIQCILKENSDLNLTQILEIITKTDYSIQSIEQLCLYLALINGTIIDASLKCSDELNTTKMYASIEMILKSKIFHLNLISSMMSSIEWKSTSRAENEMFINNILNCMYISSLGQILEANLYNIPLILTTYAIDLKEKVAEVLKNTPKSLEICIKEQIIKNAQIKGQLWAFASLHLINFQPYNDPENGLILLFEDLLANDSDLDMPNNLIIQTISTKMGKRQLPIISEMFKQNDILTKMITLRCLIENYFESDYNDLDDHQIIDKSLECLQQISVRLRGDKTYLLYNMDISNTSSEKILFVAEVANFISTVIKYFPSKLNTDIWDLVRIALSSWVLSISKSYQNAKLTKIAVFISSVLRLFDVFSKFITIEKTKSSTQILTDFFDEWEGVFSKTVNLILIKYYMEIVKNDNLSLQLGNFIQTISKTITAVDLKHVLVPNVKSAETNVDEIMFFSLENLSNRHHYVRLACLNFMKKLSKDLILCDVKGLQNRSDSEHQEVDIFEHSLLKFQDTILKFHDEISKFNNKCKLYDPSSICDLPISISMPYFMLWNSILDFCSKSPPEVRSVYALFISENEYDKMLFTTLFNLMPSDVLKNSDSIQVKQTFFSPLSDEQLSSPQLSIERYACFTYVQTLRYLPVIARKWWINLTPRQKSIVDKITTNCVSGQLCEDELRSLIEIREKQDNMQINVHISSREVLATYSIDEAKLELIITLPLNHPLGAIKVDSGKEIGGRLQSRVLVMQLAMFLTHQNGSIQNVLSLWKKNLDRKFEGVEDCYVCYSVIHQNTCQLPKLSCKTCKKKFHGPCLYKWFNTSNKSTCPICRNIF